jgi:hypothetical protein
MSIKSAIVLSCTGGIDYAQFREVSKVEAFVNLTEREFRRTLSSLRHFTWALPETASTFLASYKHPSDNHNKHLDILHELFDKVNTLQSIHSMLVSGFSEMPKAQPLIARVQALLEYAKRKVDKALVSLSAAVERYQPEYFRTCVSTVAKKLSAKFPCSTVSLLRVIKHPEKGHLLGTQFSVYLKFAGVVDSSGYKHDHYHVVLTCVVDRNGQYSMNYALQPTLILPGKFRATAPFSSPSDCYDCVVKHLKEEGFDWSQ